MAEPMPDPVDPNDPVLPNFAVDDLLSKIKHDFRWPKPSEEAVTAALHAIQRLAVNAGLDADGKELMELQSGCPHCGAANSGSNRYCGFCGSKLPKAEKAHAISPTASGAHHVYHHHYHHHFVEKGMPQEKTGDPAASGPPVRKEMGGEDPSEDLRRLVRDWTLYCNSRRIDDLAALYSSEAIILRPNVAAARGRMAIRALLQAALDGGLGDVELDSSDTGALDQIACLSGRSRMLVPVGAGKRQEQTGKYLMVARKQGGEWKILADAWSMDALPEEAVNKVASVPLRAVKKTG
jgi:ketosteroid isomerase-like protein